jgi:hypothetical protein
MATMNARRRICALMERALNPVVMLFNRKNLAMNRGMILLYAGSISFFFI